MIHATYTPADHGTRPAFTIDGKLYRAKSGFHLARALLAEGRNGSEALKCPGSHAEPLNFLAQWTISEGDSGIKLRRYQPFDRADLDDAS